MNHNIDAYPALTAPDTDWVNDPPGYMVNQDEAEHLTGVSDGMTLAGLTDIPTPWGVDVADPNKDGQSNHVEVPLGPVGFEPIFLALQELMHVYSGAVKTREILPARFNTQVYVFPVGISAPMIALGSDMYRRRTLLCYTGGAADVPLIAGDASSAQSGMGFPIPNAAVMFLEMRTTDEIWLVPKPTGNAAPVTVYLLTCRDGEPI